jgi:hypothetical protein
MACDSGSCQPASRRHHGRAFHAANSDPASSASPKARLQRLEQAELQFRLQRLELAEPDARPTKRT